MKWINGIIAYAVIVFAGGTMQSVMNVPYTNQIKDGHELTRDLMSGVVVQTAMQDVFAGIPMFGRYAGAFDFRKTTSTDPMVLANSEYIVNDSNKMREIGFLPALHFSAEAGELKQVSYEQPIEMFGNEEEIVFDKNVWNYINVVGISHSNSNTYILYSGIKKGQGEYVRLYYANEKTPLQITPTTLTDTSQVICYNGVTLFNASDGIYRFTDGNIVLVRAGDMFNWLMGSFVFLRNSVVDLNTNEEMSITEINALSNNLSATNESWKKKFVIKYKEAKRLYGTASNNMGIGRFAPFVYYQSDSVRGFKSIDPSYNPETITLETTEKGGKIRELLQPISQIRLMPQERDISRTLNNGVLTFAVSADYQYFVDIGSGTSPYLRDRFFRSHNYLYLTTGTLHYRIQLRQNKIYGNKPYIERGRSWQH